MTNDPRRKPQCAGVRHPQTVPCSEVLRKTILGYGEVVTVYRDVTGQTKALFYYEIGNRGYHALRSV